MRSTAHELPSYLTERERRSILQREADVRAFRKTLPKRKKREHELPGPVIQVTV